MANFAAADVKRLRDATGAGMMDSKRALEEADGDFDKAAEVLRDQGQREGSETRRRTYGGNGLVASADDAHHRTALETDFVAKNDQFQTLAGDIVATSRGRPPTT